ncbi:MAG: cytochrome c [Gemmatimonadota bacterium]|nr:cytochrome c [Gemmatimonadota bacterium]
MRILLARLLVAVTGLVIVLMAAAFALIRNAPRDAAVAPSAATSDLVARGRAVYQAQRCGRCHSLGGEGNPAHPLDGVGARLVERDIRKWIVAPQEMNPRVAKRGYALPAGELDALVAYLRAGTAD